jgi:threonine synthase
MDWQLLANHNGHIACTHGGESLAGLVTAKNMGIVAPNDVAIVDSTAHALKFAGFQDLYFEQRFPPEFNIQPKKELINKPLLIHPQDLAKVPAPGKPLLGDDFQRFVDRVSQEIASALDLQKVPPE